MVHGATGRIDPKADDAAEQYISRSHAFKVGGNYTAAFVTAFNAADGYVVFGDFGSSTVVGALTWRLPMPLDDSVQMAPEWPGVSIETC